MKLPFRIVGFCNRISFFPPLTSHWTCIYSGSVGYLILQIYSSLLLKHSPSHYHPGVEGEVAQLSPPTHPNLRAPIELPALFSIILATYR